MSPVELFRYSQQFMDYKLLQKRLDYFRRRIKNASRLNLAGGGVSKPRFLLFEKK